ncbi:MAG: hypothetical protein FJ316_03280 [SAR202 cluster bacterium]|nr:hypothetical protein [SAR202 cluster bacterium]
MGVGTRRSDTEIIREILATGTGRTTELRHAVNLSHPQLQKYLTFLEQAQLIKLERRQTKSLVFQVTGKGDAVLALLDQLFEALSVGGASAAWNGSHIC